MANYTNRRIVTVFGASGFIGRHLVRRLAKDGWFVRAVCRDTEKAHYLRTMGDVGQITPWGGDVSDPASVHVALDGADACVNLVGVLYESGKATFEKIHSTDAKLVAETAASFGITNFVQLSALGADKNAEAEYARSKAAGEEATLSAMPTARIVRPSVVFGPEDNFFNLFAGLCRVSPFLPVIGGSVIPYLGDGGPKFQPVYVGDVADAVVQCLNDAATQGKTFELVGPRVYSFADLMRLVLKFSSRKRILLPVPFWVAEIEAFFLEKLPKPLLTRDQIKLMHNDNVASGTCPGLMDLGIKPTPCEAILPSYLRRYRTPLAQSKIANS